MPIEIIYGHEGGGYQRVLDLRNSVLKRPEFIGVTPEVIERDKNSVHFLLIEDENAIGCVSLLIEAEKGILRQMAVLSNQRKKVMGES